MSDSCRQTDRGRISVTHTLAGNPGCICAQRHRARRLQQAHYVATACCVSGCSCCRLCANVSSSCRLSTSGTASDNTAEQAADSKMCCEAGRQALAAAAQPGMVAVAAALSSRHPAKACRPPPKPTVIHKALAGCHIARGKRLGKRRAILVALGFLLSHLCNLIKLHGEIGAPRAQKAVK